MECPVCYGTDSLVPCCQNEHYICVDCLKQCKSRRQNCPMCRQSIKVKILEIEHPLKKTIIYRSASGLMRSLESIEEEYINAQPQQTAPRTIRCGKCRQTGHNRRTCQAVDV